MVNYEIKSQLAKLLATEDIIVENKNVETAQFNVTDRVLTLPRWTFASDVVYDLLVGPGFKFTMATSKGATESGQIMPLSS